MPGSCSAYSDFTSRLLKLAKERSAFNVSCGHFTVPSNIAGVPSILYPQPPALRDGKLPLGTLITTSHGERI